MATLVDACEVIMGQAPPGVSYNDCGEGIPLVAGAGDFKGGRLAPTRYTTSPTRVSDNGDIILSVRASIGDAVWSDGQYCLGRGVAALRPRRGVDPRYLWHWLHANRSVLLQKGRGATFLQVSKRDIEALEVNIVDLGRQQMIAGVLDQADAIRTKRRASLALFDELLRALFYETFGGLRDNFDHRPLKDFVTLEGGRNLVAEDPKVESPYRVLKISSVTTGIFRESESKPLPADYEPPAHHLLKRGDLLISRANTSQLVGAVAHVQVEPQNLVLPDKIWRINFLDPGSSPTFYREMLRLPSFRAKISRASSGTSGSMKNISKSKLLSLEIPAVPVQLQQEFAARVEQINAQRALVERALEKDEELFASLQSRAFSGEL